MSIGNIKQRVGYFKRGGEGTALKDANLSLVEDALRGMAFQTEQSTAVSCETAALSTIFASFFRILLRILAFIRNFKQRVGYFRKGKARGQI